MSDSDRIGDTMRLKIACEFPSELLLLEAAALHTHSVGNTRLLLYKPFNNSIFVIGCIWRLTITMAQCLLSLSLMDRHD